MKRKAQGQLAPMQPLELQVLALGGAWACPYPLRLARMGLVGSGGVRSEISGPGFPSAASEFRKIKAHVDGGVLDRPTGGLQRHP